MISEPGTTGAGAGTGSNSARTLEKLDSVRITICGVPGVFVLLAAMISVPSMRPAGEPVGESLYRKGMLPSGDPVQGVRESGGTIEGEAAACVNCHRRSGLGTVEGRIVMPPITAKYLFRPGARNSEELDIPPDAIYPDRGAYNDELLARAIRSGIASDGRILDYLMPRYRLNDGEMHELIAYLKGLSSGPVPGVTNEILHFATIITPDADPVKRKGMLDVLERFFATKSAFYRGDAPPLQSARRIRFRVLRKWQLHVWELTGSPDTWEDQLHHRLQAEPVFAVISGLAGKTWEPVHRFCERESLPCLMPNVDLPVVSENDFYSVYFSKGVILEAQLISRSLQDSGKAEKLHRIFQIFRKGDIGSAAARALRAAAAPMHLQFVDQEITAGTTANELAGLLHNPGAADAVVLWLGPEDLRKLPPQSPPIRHVFVSGVMAGLENAPLPESWREVTRLTYPYELPGQRAVRMNYPLRWFAVQHIPVVDERTQTDTYIACSILAENLGPMLDNFVRDYLIERVEVMLSARLINGYYPRLGLAPGQRFASKGGYLVHFAAPSGTKLVADSDWVVP